MSNANRRFDFKFFAALLTVLIICFAAPAEGAFAAETASVSSPEEFSMALADDTVSAVAVTVPSVVLSDGINITHNVVITGSGAAPTLYLSSGTQLRIAEGVTVRFDNIELKSTEGYSVSCYGRILFGENVTLSGDYGVLLNSGSEAISEGRTVGVSSETGRAIGINAGNGRVTLKDLSIAQSSGSTHLVYLHQSKGELYMSGNVSLFSNNSNGIMCPNNTDISPSVTIADGAAVSVYAPNSSNTGANAAGGAIDTAYGEFKIGKGAAVSLTGGESAVVASNIEIGSGSRVNISSSVSTTGGNAALSSTGGVTIHNGATVNIGTEQEVSCGGIYAAKGLTVGDNSQIIIRCTANAKNAVYSAAPITFGNDVSLTVRGASNGIVTEHGIVTGERCVIDISSSDYGIKGTGTLIADKLEFGQSNTLTVNADYCAIYTREAFQIEYGGRATIGAGSKAPALWIDAEATAPGYITVVGSNVTVTSSAGGNAAHNAGVYVVGALTAEQNSVFYSESNSDFGILGMNGDINVSSGSSLYSRSGCGIYINNGDIRLSDGGALFAHGLVDSAVRIENGVVNVGEKASVDLQGERFGVEVLGEGGGLRIFGASSFDIRSLSNRAVFIENGTLSIENTERVSVWEQVEGKANADVWWSGAREALASWELTASDSGITQNYADHTRLAPSGMQTFRNGEPVDVSSLDWPNAAWETYRYSRIGMYKSRPTARANTFNIPAGKSFSWWLNGESYDDGKIIYELTASTGDGEFNLNPNGRFTYTAPSYTRGIQTFKFTVTNGEGAVSSPTEIKINVTASKPPIAYSSTFRAKKNEAFIGQLELHDFDGAISSTVVTKEPENGVLALSSDGKFVYTPNMGFTGLDSFEFYGVDDYGDKSNIGYVTIIVGAESGYYASNDTYATDSGAEVSARLVLLSLTKPAENVSPTDIASADDDIDYTGFKFVVTQRPEYGTFSVSEDGFVTYTPFPDFAGSDMFRYYAVTPEGAITNEAIVTVAIIPSQRPTVDNCYYTCSKNLYLNGKVTAADIDGTLKLFTVTSMPEHGELSFNDLTGEFKYVPEKDYLGSVSFTYTVTDDDGLVSREATVSIEVLNLIDSLRAAGRLMPAILACCGILAAAVVFAWLLISAVIKRNRREKEELEEYYRDSMYTR